ncbi:BAHD acyltransferase At5g47980 [Amaranthus tricolor]|uniref:BAHD acyltransferase At5g47980 n=1 Tax=Amaranthus tricolor TaxID=29722 RepID=UPI0025900119|nr:BAHD acyltransferase At5g47980 [Amaranthus tricolor]
MADLIKVTRLARQYIKPFMATPSYLRNYKFSLLDQLSPSVYAPMVFFYPTQDLHNQKPEPNNRVNHLKQSLSPFLNRFYPFAGRIKDHVSIDCNDAGVEFLEAKVNTHLEDFLKQPNANALKHFLPVDIESRSKMGMDNLVHIQSNVFECGGLALGICWSHKITDGGTVSAFMRGWSSIASGSGKEVVPEYVASSLIPPMDLESTQHELKLDRDRTITRRFVFDGSKIVKLKARVMSKDVPKPTRVEAVSSLLWKCATRASRANSSSRALSAMSQSMNIRRRTMPPLPDTSIGNLVGYYVAKMEDNGDNIVQLKDLVAKQRQGKSEAINNYAKKLQGKDAYTVIRELFNEAGSLLRRDDVDFFKCLSTCGDGLYDADFGWGKPIWLSLVSLGYKNTFALSETNEGGGIEAWVTLKEDDMAMFEQDLELLAFAESNPSVLKKDEDVSRFLEQEETRLMIDDSSYKSPLLTW